jgi:hypothetical protein
MAAILLRSRKRPQNATGSAALNLGTDFRTEIAAPTNRVSADATLLAVLDVGSDPGTSATANGEASAGLNKKRLR